MTAFSGFRSVFSHAYGHGLSKRDTYVRSSEYTSIFYFSVFLRLSLSTLCLYLSSILPFFGFVLDTRLDLQFSLAFHCSSFSLASFRWFEVFLLARSLFSTRSFYLTSFA
jgi:hypothetical protein